MSQKISAEQKAELVDIFGEETVNEWLDEDPEEALNVLKAFKSDEEIETKKKKPKKDEEDEDKKKKPKKDEEEEEKKKKPPKKDEEYEYPEKEKAGKAEAALKGIAKLLKSIEPEKVRSKVAKLLSGAGLDLAKYGYGKYEYGTPAKKELEEIKEELKGLKALLSEKAADKDLMEDAIEAVRSGDIAALERVKTLMEEKEVVSAREAGKEEELTDEEKKQVEIAKKALKEVLDEQSEGGWDRLYKHPGFQSQQK